MYVKIFIFKHTLQNHYRFLERFFLFAVLFFRIFDFTLGFFFLPRVLRLFCLFFLRRVSFGNVIRFVLRRLPPTAGGGILSVKYIVAEGAGNFVNKVAYRT